MADHVVNYWVEEDTEYVCFKHAVKAVLNDKEVAEYGEDRLCAVCERPLG